MVRKRGLELLHHVDNITQSLRIRSKGRKCPILPTPLYVYCTRITCRRRKTAPPFFRAVLRSSIGGQPHPHIQFRNAIEGRVYACPHLLSYFTFNVAVVLCVKVPEVPLNVSVNVPREAPFGTAKSTVTLAISDPDVSVTDDGMTVHVEPGGPPLQVKPIVPVKPVVEDSVRV